MSPVPTELTGWSQNPSKGGCREFHLERLEVREKLGLTDVLRSRSWGPEKLATCRPRGTLLPGAREPGGPMSCREGQVRRAGSALPSPTRLHFSSPPGAQEPQSKAGGQSCAGPAPLRPGQAAPGRRVQSQTAVWVAARQQGGLAQGVPQALRAPGPDECPRGPFEGQRGKSVAGRPQGSV